jgi:hypothetical protein
MRGAGQLVLCSPFFVERRHKMGIRDWDIVTSYVDSVTTSLKTVTFPKVQEQVKVKNQGNANLTYTIGSQSGTLTPGQSITVNEDISSFSIQAASGTQAFELRAKEKGTEQTETESDVMTALTDITTNVENFPRLSVEMDDSPRIQRAHDSMNGKAGILFLPRTAYTVNSPVNITNSSLIIQGNGLNTVITSNQDNNIFYVTGSYVTFRNLKLIVTSVTRTKYTVQCFNTTKTIFKDVYFDNTGSSLSGIWFNGGSMGLVENCMFNHSRINVGTWDVKIDKCYIWALSQDYGIGITNGSGNTTITNTDIVPPLKTLTTRKAGIWIDSSVSACFNTKMTNVYFDGNPSLDTGVGLLITPRTGLVTLSDFSANKMDDDVVVIDSAFGVTVERGLFSNNNDKGTGTREIYIKKSGSQALENINIRNNQFVQTTTITGTVAPTIEVDSTVTAQGGIKIQFNDIKQPGGGGSYSEPEIKCDSSQVDLRGNSGTLSKYNAKGSIAVASGASGVTISSLGGVYPLAYESHIGKYVLQAEGFTLPSYRIQKINRNSIFISFATATTAAGTLYWSVEL